jgi:hypothetical protein
MYIFIYLFFDSVVDQTLRPPHAQQTRYHRATVPAQELCLKIFANRSLEPCL